MNKIGILSQLRTCLQRVKAYADGLVGELAETATAAVEELDASKQDKLYATCATTSATTAKVAALPGFTLATGAVVAVKFTYTNTASAPTLNVNGTGAKPIKKYATISPDTYMWQTGAVVLFVYDGSNWIMANGTSATTTYEGVVKLSSSTSSTSTAMAATPSAVKAAYDRAGTAITNAQTAKTAADNAQATADASQATAEASQAAADNAQADADAAYGLAEGKADKPSAADAVLSAASWASGDGEYAYYYDIPVTGVTAADRADVVIAPGSAAAARACGMCPACETLAGVVRLRAAKAPQVDMNIQYWITKGA